MPWESPEVYRRRVEDERIETIGTILDAYNTAIPYRRLVKEVDNPGADIVEQYRSSMLVIYAMMEQIAEAAIEQNRRDREGY